MMKHSNLVVPDLQAGRRRRFTTQEKEAILAEACRNNESLSELGRRYGIAVSLLFRWKRSLNFDPTRYSWETSSAAETAPGENLATRVIELESTLSRLVAHTQRLEARLAQFEALAPRLGGSAGAAAAKRA
ncbi:MAG: transposase [Myxococcales bacterium]|nr:transposase [Myxococcales bacterium]